MAHDLVIRGGTIVDGTGSPGTTGDVAVDGDRLTQIGGKADAGQRELHADGRVVARGSWIPTRTTTHRAAGIRR